VFVEGHDMMGLTVTIWNRAVLLVRRISRVGERVRALSSSDLSPVGRESSSLNPHAFAAAGERCQPGGGSYDSRPVRAGVEPAEKTVLSRSKARDRRYYLAPVGDHLVAESF